MNTELKHLVSELIKIAKLEDKESLETLGGYITGEILGDQNNKYSNLYESNRLVQKIGDLASDLERSNGEPAELWQKIKDLIEQLDGER